MTEAATSLPIDAHAKASRRPQVPCSAGTVLNLEDPEETAAHLPHAESETRALEEAFRASQERYRSLFTGIEDYAIFMLDPEGRVVSWNSEAERIQGYSAPQIIGHSFSCFFPPEEVRTGRPREALRLAASRGRHQEYGMRVRRDGSQFFACVNFTALRDPAGNLSGFSELIHDLSEHEVGGVRYRALLEAALDAMVVVTRAGEIVLMNLKAEQQFGYCHDELLGRNVSVIVPAGLAEPLSADGLPSADESRARLIGSEKELIGRRKNGSEFPIEVRLSPLGSLGGILVTAAIRDISARQAADRRLARIEGRNRALLEAAPDAMIVVNPLGEIVLLNAQAESQFGYRRDDLIGQEINIIIPVGFAERLKADGLRSAADVSKQQTGDGIELAGRRKDGSVFPIEIMLSPLDSDDGILVMAAIRNITSRKKAEADLRHVSDLERMQSEFVSTVSHELRTPLTSIGGSLGLIAGGATGVISDRTARMVEIASNNTQRLIHLVNDILDMEKLHSGRLEFQFSRVRIEDVLQQAIAANLAYAAGFGIELRHVGEKVNAVVKADTERLIQAITNLISNAVKFSPSGAIVQVSASRTVDGVRISIADQGPGIPDEFRARIFERFAQADSSGIRQRGGSGLGLSIVREIVRRHHGAVSFDSVLDKGSTFHLDFPPFDEAEHESTRAATELKVVRAIVCAANAGIAEPICAILRTRGFECAAVLTDQQTTSPHVESAEILEKVDLPLVREDLGGLVRALRDGRAADHFPVVLLCVESVVEDRSPASRTPHQVKIDPSATHDCRTEAIRDRCEAVPVKRPAVLHVEDDHDVLAVVCEAFGSEFRVVAASTLERARQCLGNDRFDVIILDLTLSDGLGKDLFPHLVDSEGRPIPIVVFTAQDSAPELAGRVETVLTKSRDDLTKLVETVRSTVAATVQRSLGVSEAQDDDA